MPGRYWVVVLSVLGCSSQRGPTESTTIATLRNGYHLPGLIATPDSLRVATNGSDILVAGELVQAGEVIGHPALWTRHWQALPLFDAFRVAAAGDGTLYAASRYVICDLCGPARVMRLENDTWTPLPGDLQSDVQALLAAPGRVVVAGQFRYGPNIVANDGTGWSNLGTTDGSALAEHDGTICAAGSFTHVDGVAAASVACLANGT
jgi:hypothetical protein